MRHFDLVIIGTGSGNSIIGPEFGDWDIAIIERGVFGGTCLNVGCIPTKMFVYAAEVASSVRRASRFGIDATVDKVRWTDIRDRIFGRIDPIAASGERYRTHDNPNVTVYKGQCRFVGQKRLDTGTGETITADRFVIATGARPVIPREVAICDVPYYTSDTVMRLDALPQRMVILGGGYIAVEFAHVFSALGVQVSVVARGSALLRRHDETVTRRFTEAAKRQWDVHLGQAPCKVEAVGSEVVLTTPDGARVPGDELLVAVGRVPNADLLDLAATGVTLTLDGRVAVDRYQRTEVHGIFALGDVSSPYLLKHVANHEARVVRHNLRHPDSPIAADHRFVPSAVFTDPQLASVGLTEAQCRLQKLDYAVAVQEYADVAYGWALEDTTGFCKVLADRRTGRLLGAHIMGPAASTVIQPLIQAMSFGLGAAEMATGQYWIHPALPEVVENALLKLDL
ncbi:MAG TPA: mycothione reductase [Pseudonocardiaceae bacterium]